MTALSPCWEGEGAPGVIPITALTRRHGYTRGHGIRPDGFGKTFAGERVWFLSTNNQVVQTSVLREVVRTMPGSGRDYTIFLFSKDLPASIEPMRVVTTKELFSRYTLSDIFQRLLRSFTWSKEEMSAPTSRVSLFPRLREAIPARPTCFLCPQSWFFSAGERLHHPVPRCRRIWTSYAGSKR